LRKAREAAGLSLEDVAAQLQMPARVVQSLEEEDWARLGAPVFVRGQMRSYSRLLGLVTSTTVAARRRADRAAGARAAQLHPRMHRLSSRARADGLHRDHRGDRRARCGWRPNRI
jgi:cytoskeleton protein RodZ